MLRLKIKISNYGIWALDDISPHSARRQYLNLPFETPDADISALYIEVGSGDVASCHHRILPGIRHPGGRDQEAVDIFLFLYLYSMDDTEMEV